MSATTYDDQSRARARQLADRVKGDPAWRQRIEADPFGALAAEGLSEGETIDFTREAGIAADVAGYARCTNTCDDTCVVTCWVTSW